MSEPGPSRVVISDDGSSIRLMVYVGGLREPIAVAELEVVQAARVDAELSAAVAAHLARQRNGRAGVRRGPP